MRRKFSALILIMAFFIIIASLMAISLDDPEDKENSCDSLTSKSGENMSCMIIKTDDEWEAQLTEEEYYITRKKGTERAFTGKYYKHTEKGTYTCVCCGIELFSSETKYESGSGWPSFWSPVNQNIIKEEKDLSNGMVRTEVQCSNCGAHLGHVFSDGPEPTGLRYCINSAALKFVKDNSE